VRAAVNKQFAAQEAYNQLNSQANALYESYSYDSKAQSAHSIQDPADDDDERWKRFLVIYVS